MEIIQSVHNGCAGMEMQIFLVTRLRQRTLFVTVKSLQYLPPSWLQEKNTLMPYSSLLRYYPASQTYANCILLSCKIFMSFKRYYGWWGMGYVEYWLDWGDLLHVISIVQSEDKFDCGVLSSSRHFTDRIVCNGHEYSLTKRAGKCTFGYI